MSHIHIGLSGRYTIEKRNAAGDIVQTLEFDNLITDAGLERWGTAGVIDRCWLGSGSTPPAVTDLALAAPLGSSTSKVTAPADSYDVATVKQTYYQKWRFGPGVCTGDIREVGAGWDTGLWSRALVLDGLGSPTTISKLSDETLDVLYTVVIQYPLSDLTGKVTVGGLERDWQARPNLYTGSTFAGIFGTRRNAAGSNARAYDGGLSGYSSAPSGSSIGYTANVSAGAYVAGSKSGSITAVFGVDDPGNYRTFTFYVGPALYTTQLQFQVTPAIPKAAEAQLTFTVSHSWGRA